MVRDDDVWLDVLQTKQLDKRRSGNVATVAPQKEIADFEQAKEDARISLEERAEKVTEYIPVNYANAEDIARGQADGIGDALIDRLRLDEVRVNALASAVRGQAYASAECADRAGAPRIMTRCAADGAGGS